MTPMRRLLCISILLILGVPCLAQQTKEHSAYAWLPLFEQLCDYDDIESLDALRARAAAFLQFVRDNYEGKTVLAVGHGITNKAIRSVHSGTPMNETPRMANAEVVTMQL